MPRSIVTVPRLIAVFGTSALALSLTACGGAKDGGGFDATAQSPIDVYLSAAWGGNLSPEEQERRWAEIQTNTETAVAACMKAEGFEYTPNLPVTTQPLPVPDAEDDVYDPESEEWVSKYGYGIVVSPWGDILIDPMPLPMPEPGSDPNADYVNSLSATEQEAYSAALYGPVPTDEELAGEYEYDWRTAGCFGAANHEFAPVNVYDDAQFRPLLEAIDTFRATLWDDPAFAQLDARWSACMDDAGYPGLLTQSAAVATISEAHAKLWESAADAGIDPEDPAVVALGKEEVDIAIADLRCRKTTDYYAEQQRLQFSLEEAFVQAHQAEFDAFRSAAEQSMS